MLSFHVQKNAEKEKLPIRLKSGLEFSVDWGNTRHINGTLTMTQILNMLELKYPPQFT